MEIRDVASGRMVGELLGHENWIHSLAFNSDGSQLATGGWDGQVRIWNVATGDELARISGHEGAVLAVSFSPDGGRLASTGYDQTIRTWVLS